MLTLWGALVELFRPGESRVSGRVLLRLARVALTTAIVLANLIGAVAVLVIALFVVPVPDLHRQAPHVKHLNTIIGIVYIAAAIPAGALLGTRGMRRLRVWLAGDRAAGEAEKRFVLLAPRRLFLLQLSLWLAAAVLFGAIDLAYSTTLSIRVLVLIAITGTITASCAYLLTEILLRPVAARALGEGLPDTTGVPGVATRAILAWLLGTGLPVLGVVAIGVLGLTGDPATKLHKLSLAVVVLGGAGLLVGLLVVTVAARATADPVASVRRALARVRQGDFTVRVPVYDGTQIGQLQHGFNEMVGGLSERERIRDLFGAYVDRDVAEHLLTEGTSVSGERVLVTVMFIDVRGFTSFTERHAPEEVLAALNRLFQIAVKVIHAHGGRVDKFVGDGLLAVFGAPRRLEDHAEQALAAAREIAEATAANGELEIGVGLDSGEVLAGNVGGAGRLEFTVIGDTVNVAARVEAATRQTGDVILLTDRTHTLLDPRTATGLDEREPMELRGKQERVRVYATRVSARPSPARPPSPGTAR